jgi:hypothetical protein
MFDAEITHEIIIKQEKIEIKNFLLKWVFKRLKNRLKSRHKAEGGEIS